MTLFIHNREAKSIFETLGTKENGLTYSLGYVLSNSPKFLKALVKYLHPKKVALRNVVIKLQEPATRSRDKGITDIEIVINNEVFILVECKKGWNVPPIDQLKKYRSRFGGFSKRKCMYVVLSDCTEEYVKNIYKESLYNIPIQSLSWQKVAETIDDNYRSASHREKFLLNEFRKYLSEAVFMESQESNWVYVVSLSNDKPGWSKIGWIDYVKNKLKYFYPQGKNWPPVPPNYMGFRYGGRLQSIHHVEKYEVVDDLHDYIPEVKKGKLRNMFLLWLGDPFEPRKELPNGNIWTNGRLWCMLDTLFTCDTIQQANVISKRREKS